MAPHALPRKGVGGHCIACIFLFIFLRASNAQTPPPPVICEAGMGAAPRRSRGSVVGPPCIPCAVNTYSPTANPVTLAKCLACPKGATTRGLTSSQTCYVQAGSYFNDKKRVVKCLANSYCFGGDVFTTAQLPIACPLNTTTAGTTGSDEVGDCLVSPGFVYNEATSKVIPCPVGLYCLGGRITSAGKETSSCPTGQATLKAGAKSARECAKTAFCSTSPCLNGAKCVEGTTSYVCQCKPGYSGVNCETDVNDCASKPCKHGGKCVDGVNAFTCECPAQKTTGQLCETIRAGNFWDAKQSKVESCPRGSWCAGGTTTAAVAVACTCTDAEHGCTPVSVDGATDVGACSCDCSCPEGQERVGNACLPVCGQGSTRNAQTGDCIPTCHTGFDLVDGACVDVDECLAATSPCPANSVCSNALGSYSCTCMTGYSKDGALCVDDDECAAPTSPCPTNANCVNTAGGFDCPCKAGWTGDQCATSVEDCTPTSCKNGGKCVDGDSAFTCQCKSGWEGPTCEDDVDECLAATSPCPANSVCSNALGSYSCTCMTGYVSSGGSCKAELNGSCAVTADCITGLTCSSLMCKISTGRTCLSTAPANCETGFCSSSVCVSSCPTGYSGSTCSTCSAGYTLSTSSTCLVDVNGSCSANGQCITNLCSNLVCKLAVGDACSSTSPTNCSSGICSASKCVASCPTGYTGSTCSTCSAGYTLSGSTCLANVNGACSADAQCITNLCSNLVCKLAVGDTCTSISPTNCSSGICSASKCVASCPTGYTGSTCSTCSAGYTLSASSTCLVDVNGNCSANGQCITNLCSNSLCKLALGATCSSSSPTSCASGICSASKCVSSCPTGYTGSTCSLCSTNYVLTGTGTCTACVKGTSVGGSSTQCNCPTGYSGATCNSCAAGYTGTSCSTCATNYILSGGLCLECLNGGVSGGGSATQCGCPTGYTDATCSSCATSYVWTGTTCLLDLGGTCTLGTQCASGVCGGGGGGGTKICKAA